MAERGRNKGRGPLAKKSSKSIKDELLALTPLSDAIDFYKAAKAGNVMEAAMAAGMMGLAATPAGPLAKGAKAVKKVSDPYLDLLTEKQPDFSYFFRGVTPQIAKDVVDEGVEITKDFHLTNLPTGAARYAGPQGEVIRIRMPKGSFPEGKRSVVDKNPEMMGMDEWVLSPKQANELLERDDVKIDRIPTSVIYSAIDKK